MAHQNVFFLLVFNYTEIHMSFLHVTLLIPHKDIS